MFGGFRERAQHTYELLKQPGTAFVVVAAPEPDALREASYFVERLGTEKMPLAGMVLNRTHPVHATQMVNPASLRSLQFGGTAPVISFDVTIALDAPPGDYSLRLQSNAGEIAYLVGALAVGPKQ